MRKSNHQAIVASTLARLHMLVFILYNRMCLDLALPGIPARNLEDVRLRSTLLVSPFQDSSSRGRREPLPFIGDQIMIGASCGEMVGIIPAASNTRVVLYPKPCCSRNNVACFRNLKTLVCYVPIYNSWI